MEPALPAKCPNCDVPVKAGAPECPGCGLIYEKWMMKNVGFAEPASAKADIPPPCVPAEQLWLCYRYPAVGAVLAAFVYALNFRSFLPITEGWAMVEKTIFPLTFLTLAIHEAGHLLMGFFGSEFLMTAGGSLFQLSFPLAVFFHFLKRENTAGCLFAVFWTGYSLINVSFYMADAQIQGLVLITGKTGREGGLHDWNYLLGQLGLLKQAVELARMVFFAGVVGMVFSVLAAGKYAVRGAGL